MELQLWELSILIIIIGVIILIAIRLFRQPNIIAKQQKASKEVTIKEAHGIEKQVLSETIDTLKKNNRSLQNTVNKIRGLQDYDGNGEEKPVPIEMLQEVAKGTRFEKFLENDDALEWVQEQLKDPEAKKLLFGIIKQKATSKNSEDEFSLTNSV